MVKQKSTEAIVRIFNTDIPARMTVYAGLTKVKGISWSISNAICNLLHIDKKTKFAELDEEKLKEIEDFFKKYLDKLPSWLLNRRFDRETGQDKHLLGSDLDIVREFDIRRLKQIKCYRGWRHALGLPVRGQRTCSHFRHGTTIGVTKKSKTGK